MDKLNLLPNKSLPRDLTDVPLRAVLTGPVSYTQAKFIRHSFELRRSQLQELLLFFQSRNRFMPPALVDLKKLAALPSQIDAPSAVVLSDPTSDDFPDFGLQ